jgi:hypothetical protein
VEDLAPVDQVKFGVDLGLLGVELLANGGTAYTVCFDPVDGGAPVGSICLEGDAVGVPVESSEPGLNDFDF